MDADSISVHKHTKISQYSANLTSCLGNNPNFKMPSCKQYLASFFACLARITCCVPQEKVFFPNKKSFIGQSCAVKTAGFWHHSFFPFLQNWTLFRSINTQKALGQYPVVTPGQWPICLVRLNALLQILGLLRYCFSRNFCATFRCSKGSKRPSPLSTKNKLKLHQAFFSYVTGLKRIISPNSAVIEANPP